DEFLSAEWSVRVSTPFTPRRRDGCRGFHHMLVVRRASRGGGELLHIRIPELEDREDYALHRGRSWPGRRGGHGRVRGEWSEVRRAKRRPSIHVRRGDLVRDPMRGPGRG